MKVLCLHCSAGSGCLLVASEIKGLLASRAVPRNIDSSAVRAFLQLGHVPPPWTAIQGVKPLEPGYIGVWQGGNFQTPAHWNFPMAKNVHAPDSPGTISGEL